MLSKSSWLHLRIPFSYFLMPVFILTLALSPNINQSRGIIVFLILHFFLYPASNGYNSYFDKDEESIGGLKHPPKVSRGLYALSLLFDFVAIALGLLINVEFAIMLFVYGLVSKAYSHPAIRIKKYPWASWFIAGLFQGSFTMLMAYIGLNDFGLAELYNQNILIASLLSSAILWGSYPMTQIYQHGEDGRRGDRSLSIKLGILGTFHFTGISFTFASLGFFFYFQAFHDIAYSYLFMGSMFPVIVFFSVWYFKVRKDRSAADYGHTMWLNFISATCLNAFFFYLFLESQGLGFW